MTPVPGTSKDKPAMATKEGAQVHCNHPLNRKNLLKESHSVGTIRGQHYHLVSKDETNSMDSQSAKVMDDTSRFLSPKLLPLLRLSRFEVINKADIRWWHHQKKKSWTIWPKHTVCRFCQFFYRHNPFGDRFVKKNQCCF